jgi:peptide/nickel transport system ATP-binding protein
MIVSNLSLSFKFFGKKLPVLKNINLSIKEGESIAIVGESGSGKTTLGKSLLGLNPLSQTVVESGEIIYKNNNLLSLSETSLNRFRGKEIGMIFQDPLTSLNPTMSVGNQVLETIIKHDAKLDKKEAKKRVIKLFEWLGINNAEERFNHYPHQFSGGMRQRVVIAIALAPRPKILIADEPTSALDATIQIQILDLLKKIQEELKMSIILITHDLSLISCFTTKTVVMYRGEIVEEAETKTLLSDPKHPYTKKLVGSIPKLHTDKSNRRHNQKGEKPLIEAFNLSHNFVHNLTFTIKEGQTLGVVGESGSGKTTLALLLMNLIQPISGAILYKGRPFTKDDRKEIQMVFQDPYSSLDPRMTVSEIIREPLAIHRVGMKEEQKNRVLELLCQVDLDQSFLKRYPHELSGGQRQRVAIARALALNPKFLICDEPIASLDVSIQSQIIDLLKRLQEELCLTYLFISHDLAIIKEMSDMICVMYMGEIVEMQLCEKLYENPTHPYTKNLLASYLIPNA